MASRKKQESMKSITDIPIPDVEIMDTVAYVDTLGCQLQGWIPKPTFSDLKKQYGNKIEMKPCRGDLRFRSFMTIHQPDHCIWNWLVNMNAEDIRICRVDIAIDFLTRTKEEAERLIEYFKHHYRQKWQGKKEANHVEETFYISSNPRTPRNVVMYGDVISKTGLGYCAHLELRFITAERCRAAGLSDPKVFLSGPDVMRLLDHESQLVQLNSILRDSLHIKANRTALTTGVYDTAW